MNYSTRSTGLRLIAAPAAFNDGREGGAAMPDRPFRVLLIEDDTAVRKVTIRYLGLLGFAVIEAASPAQALELAAPEERIDLVLSDIAMYGMRGPAVVHELRTRRPDLPAILMTGFAIEAVSNRCWPPRTRLLLKPFSLDELRATVAELLAPSPAQPGSGPGPDGAAPPQTQDPDWERRVS
jgi:CheY-like chemotaxis protein